MAGTGSRKAQRKSQPKSPKRAPERSIVTPGFAALRVRTTPQIAGSRRSRELLLVALAQASLAQHGGGT